MQPFKINFEITTPFQEKYILSGKADKSGNGPIALTDGECMFNRRGLWIRMPQFVLHHIMLVHGDEIKAAVNEAASV